MNFSGFLTVGYFLFNVVFGLITFLLWARIALRYFYVSALHPFSLLIARCTEPFVAPVRRLFAFRETRTQRFDWPAIVVLALIEFIKFSLIGFFLLKTSLPLWLIIAYTAGDLIIQPCDSLFYAVIIRVLLSWIMPLTRHPLADILSIITDPMLRRAQRVLPTPTGLDFSPVLVIVVLKAISLFVSASLPLHLI